MLDLDMGAYGLFVWPAWAISALALIVLSARSGFRARAVRRALERLEREGGASEAS